MDRAEDALVDLIDDARGRQEGRRRTRRSCSPSRAPAQGPVALDFVNAENSMGFHAPQEAARILGEAIDYGRQGQVALRDLGTPKAARK